MQTSLSLECDRKKEIRTVWSTVGGETWEDNVHSHHVPESVDVDCLNLYRRYCWAIARALPDLITYTGESRPVLACYLQTVTPKRCASTLTSMYKIKLLVDCHLTPPYVGTYGACGIGTSMDFCRLLLEPEAQPEQADLGARSHPGTSMHNRAEH